MANNASVMKELEIHQFLKDTAWGDADVTPLSADMGLRRYFRLDQDNNSALLMDMSASDEGLESFLAIGKFLRDNDINAPEIFYADSENDCAIIEYFGDQSFGQALANGADKKEIYQKATNVLIKLRQSASQNTMNLPLYKKTPMWSRLPQFVDYYMPAASTQKPSDNIHVDYQNVWQEIEQALPDCPNTVCLGDYHLENLMWCEGQNPDYGVIDFQDAFWGGAPYDLLNLLEDARVSVPEEIKQDMKAQYCADMTEKERKAFHDWYGVMSAQFHCRVIGLFIKFAQEGRGDQFLQHIPRLQNYLKDALQNPVLTPLKAFIERHRISLDIKVDKG